MEKTSMRLGAIVFVAALFGAGAVPARAAGGSAPATAMHPFAGLSDSADTPPDTISAVGPSRYVEMVNVQMGIWDRSGTQPVASGTIRQLSGDTGSITDPTIIWDPDTNRFYYTFLDDSAVQHTGISNSIWFGFSKTASPSSVSSSDWCSYSAVFPYSTDLPDFPHLGDTRDFLLVGVNDFSVAGSFSHSDVNWIQKPAAGDVTDACPALGKTGQVPNLLTGTGQPAWTPIPVNQIDGDGQGWVVATDQPATQSGGACAPGDSMTVFSVTASSGSAVISQTGRDIPVSPYCMPPSAPQMGTDRLIDTGDSRLTQAVSAIDPAHGTVGIWTQQTIATPDGSRSEVRWYEIDPASGSAKPIVQTGDVAPSGLFAFDAAISPDRLNDGVHSPKFGDSMVLTYNTSSSSTRSDIRMISKTGAADVSGATTVLTSTGPEDDQFCYLPYSQDSTCRWGDYAGASPDPAADPAGSHGVVWLASQYTVAGADSNDIDWRTWNWEATIADVIQFGSATYGVQENVGSATITVDRFGSGDATVQYGITGGTATSGKDYTAVSGTLQWAAGDAPAKTFAVPITNDLIGQGPKTIIVSLSNPAGSAGPSLGAPSTATITIAASDQQPDAMVRAGSGSYVGSNIYNTTASGQTVVASVAPGNTETYYAVVQNDGQVSNAFRILASKSSTGFTVHYFYGTRDVTSSIEAGTFSTGLIARGKSITIRFTVAVAKSVTAGSSKIVALIASWSGDRVVRDEVAARTKAA